MTEDEAAPDGVGPHEGLELELMRAGGKPLAMFGDGVGSTYEFPEIDFAPFVAEGTFVRREVIYHTPTPGLALRVVYFARAGEEWRIEAMHQIKQRLFVHRSEEHTSELQSLMRISYAVFCLKK